MVAKTGRRMQSCGEFLHGAEPLASSARDFDRAPLVSSGRLETATGGPGGKHSGGHFDKAVGAENVVDLVLDGLAVLDGEDLVEAGHRVDGGARYGDDRKGLVR